MVHPDNAPGAPMIFRVPALEGRVAVAEQALGILIGFYGTFFVQTISPLQFAALVVINALIAAVSSSGSTPDSAGRTAINAIRAALTAHGLTS